jgi:hypothetical protein
MEKGTRKLRRKRFWKKEMDGGAWFPGDSTEVQTPVGMGEC